MVGSFDGLFGGLIAFGVAIGFVLGIAATKGCEYLDSKYDVKIEVKHADE